MESLIREEAALHERMEQIEKQNQRLKGFMLCLVVSVLALAVMGAKAGLDDGHFRQITAEGISIVDGAGQAFILIGSGKEGTGIRILNRSGKRVLGMGTTADEGGSGLLVADKEGRPRIGLGIDQGLPSVAMVNEKGKKILALGGDEQGYGFVVMDENEVERAGLGFKEGNTGVAIYDDSGKYVRGMIRQKDGIHYSSYVDQNGKEIIVK
ncbi:MAG: hypothetical protein JSU90_05615 [Nitrospiraceae bacterium]|nr:MAG: hypothetical protein JSU90_05615 [Nitrospiraceae bacterium]